LRPHFKPGGFTTSNPHRDNAPPYNPKARPSFSKEYARIVREAASAWLDGRNMRPTR